MSLAGRIYDYIVSLLARGWSLIKAMARAVSRWDDFDPLEIYALGGLGVQAFASGAAFQMLGPDGLLLIDNVPQVPDREGAWTYTGYIRGDEGRRSYFSWTSLIQLTPTQLQFQIGAAIETITPDLYKQITLKGGGTVWIDKDGYVIPGTFEMIVTRVERM